MLLTLMLQSKKFCFFSIKPPTSDNFRVYTIFTYLCKQVVILYDLKTFYITIEILSLCEYCFVLQFLMINYLFMVINSNQKLNYKK